MEPERAVTQTARPVHYTNSKIYTGRKRSKSKQTAIHTVIPKLVLIHEENDPFRRVRDEFRADLSIT